MNGIIYLAVNRANGKQYIGKTRREFGVRVREHVYDARNKGLTPFTRAVGKYGLSGFDFAVLDRCPAESLDERERYWISITACRKPDGYNLSDGGNGGSGTHRPDTARRNAAKVGVLNPQFGKRYSAEQKKRFGQPGAKNARFGVSLTPEFRKLISERTRAAMRRPEVRDKFMAAIKERHAITG